jgi:hypothetical protein
MQSIRTLAPAVAAAAVLAGCTEHTMPTDTATGAVGTSFDISDAPGSSGLHVIRGGIFLEYWLIRDPRAELAVALGSADGFPICGESFSLVHLLEVQFIGSRHDPDRPPGDLLDGLLMQALLKGDDVFATVYSLKGDFVDDCDFLLNGTRIAKGTVRMRGTDNDFNAFIRNLPIRADAFGINAHGIVNLTGGGTARLSAVDRQVFFPPDRVTETAKVRMNPIQ